MNTTTLKLWTIALIILALAPRAAGRAQDSSANARRVLAAAARDLPALSAAVAQRDALVWQDAVGWADVDARRPASVDTVFPVYSLAKIWTAAAAARLAERAQLDPNASVRQWVPAFPDKGAVITPMQLAMHRGGIRHYRDDAEASLTRHCKSPVDALPLFAADPLLFPPGTARGYSSWGYVLLSAVIEAAAGAPFDAVLRQEIFTPAKMEHTRAADPTRPSVDAAVSVSRAPDGSWQPLAPLDLTCKSGAGGYLSTPSDAAGFYMALMNGALVGPKFRPLLLQQTAQGTIEESGRGLGGTAVVLVESDTEIVVALATSTAGAYETLADTARKLAVIFGRQKRE